MRVQANYAGQDGRAEKLHTGSPLGMRAGAPFFCTREQNSRPHYGYHATHYHHLKVKLSLSLSLTYKLIMMNNRPSQIHYDDSKPIMIYGELSSDEDGFLSSSLHLHDETKSRPSTERHEPKPALSLEVSELAYFTELYAELQMVDGIEELSNKLSLVTKITRDRADEGKRNANKKRLRRCLKNKTIRQRGNTENTRIDSITQVQQSQSQCSEADHAAGGVATKITSVRDESRAARSA